MAEGECFDGIAGLAGDDEQRACQVGVGPRRPHRIWIGTVQHVETLGTERLGEHVGDQTRPTHAADEGAGQPIASDGRRQRGVLAPLRERFLRSSHPPERVHWRANIMRII